MARACALIAAFLRLEATSRSLATCPGTRHVAGVIAEPKSGTMRGVNSPQISRMSVNGIMRRTSRAERRTSWNWPLPMLIPFGFAFWEDRGGEIGM